MAAGEPTQTTGRVDPAAEVEALAAFAARAPGSDAERRAALHLASRLEDLGRAAEVESIDTWPRWTAGFGLAAALAAMAGVVSVSSPEAGAAMALVAFLLFLPDAGLAVPVARRPFGRRASQNVVSLSPDDRPGVLVIAAHLDAGRTGFVHRPGIRRLQARLARPRRLFGGPLQLLAWILATVLASCLLRLAGVEGTALTAVQFGLTVALIVTLALLLDVWLSPTVPGAGDNASGVALALRLADRLGGALGHFRVDVVLTGAQESMSDGMRAFLRRHREHLPPDRTVILNLDEVGAGAVRYTVREGPLAAVRSHRQLVALCEEIAAGTIGGTAPRPLDNRAPSDGFRAAYAGYPALTVTCRDELGLAPRHHRRSDLPEHVDAAAMAAAEELCVELVERLDAQVGPELDSG